MEVKTKEETKENLNENIIQVIDENDKWGYLQNEFGYHYSKGLGVEKDNMLALYWYGKSAKKNNRYAQYIIGIAYENGRNVDKNPSLAAYWYAKSAKQNKQSSMKALKTLLQNNDELCKSCTDKSYKEILTETKDKKKTTIINNNYLDKIIDTFEEKAVEDINKIIQENNERATLEVNKVIQEKERKELEGKKNNFLYQLKQSIDENEKILKNYITNQINLIENNEEINKSNKLEIQLENLKYRIENILSYSINNNITEYIKYNNLLATKYGVGNEITVGEKVDINSLDIEITNDKGENIYKNYKELYNKKIKKIIELETKITKEMIKTDTLISNEGLLSYKNNETLITKTIDKNLNKYTTKKDKEQVINNTINLIKNQKSQLQNDKEKLQKVAILLVMLEVYKYYMDKNNKFISLKEVYNILNKTIKEKIKQQQKTDLNLTQENVDLSFVIEDVNIVLSKKGKENISSDISITF